MADSTADSLAPDVARDHRTRALGWLKEHGLLAFCTAALAFWSLRRILQTTGGEPAAPLDDTFIHFQYARSFAELTPFRYSPGAAPAPGATSLLWPLMLALPYALGLRGEHLLWAAWLFSFTALGLLAHETRLAAAKLCSRTSAIAAAGMVLAFGGYIWFAASGMEVVPLAWLLMRSVRKAAEWSEAPHATRLGPPRELLLLAWLAPAMRPEGAVATALIAATLALRGSGARRVWALAALPSVFLPGLVNWLFTGQSTTTTAQVKWLPFSPYQQGGVLYGSIVENLNVLFDTLLDGRIWSAVFLPSGIRWLSWACVPALLLAGIYRKRQWRGLLLAGLALGMLLPTTYDSFLWNRLRYLWPFAAAWFVGAAAVVDGVSELLARLNPRFATARALLGGVLVGGLAGHLPYTFDDVADSADAIRKQQVALGRWARENLPRDARIGVNDTGAIAYFSGRRVFDVVGLTTRGEARYWAAGAGSRFEHYERLPAGERPTHFIVYPEWFALPALQGEFLTERRVPGATILGGEDMVASRADWSVLGSAERPLVFVPGERKLLDRLDVADLESEAEHDYELLPATQADDQVIEHQGSVDGARRRRARESFGIELAPAGVFVARLAGEGPGSVAVSIDGRPAGTWQLTEGEVQELELALPVTLARGRRHVEIVAAEQTFTALHYWSYAER